MPAGDQRFDFRDLADAACDSCGYPRAIRSDLFERPAIDLERRLLRYPCSYMIDTEAFAALPSVAKDAVYRRMWRILSGQESDKRYARLSLADRRAVVEILRETRKDLPDYFRPVTQ